MISDSSVNADSAAVPRKGVELPGRWRVLAARSVTVKRR